MKERGGSAGMVVEVEDEDEDEKEVEDYDKDDEEECLRSRVRAGREG